MRYRVLNTIVLLFVFFVLTSDSCDSTSEEKQRREKDLLHQKIETIKEGFEEDYLTESAKIAYEEKAKQKLVDFSDYLTLYSDKSLDKLFRKKAGEMILAFFDENENMVEFKLKASENRIRRHTEAYLKNIEMSEFDLIQMRIDSIQTYTAPERINASSYMGRLICVHSVEGIINSDTALIDRMPMSIEFYVNKVEKNIGMESKKVWRVLLGNIKVYKNPI